MRDELLQVRVTATEMRHLQAVAGVEGKSVSQLVRDRLPLDRYAMLRRYLAVALSRETPTAQDLAELAELASVIRQVIARSKARRRAPARELA